MLKTGSIDLRLLDRSIKALTADDPGHLIIWVDLLKHERPVYYWKDAHGEGLASGWEEIENHEDGMVRPTKDK